MAGEHVIDEDISIHINEEIGSGNFGRVYKGTYKGDPCAVKVLNHLAICFKTSIPAGRGQEIAMTAFDKECMVLESFQHPNVLQHFATTKHPDSDNSILVTELLNCNLSCYIKNYERSLTNVCEFSIAKDLASGLSYIHSREIMHRDLCGVNVLMKLNGSFPTAKIGDFGMSKSLDPSKLNTTIGHRIGYLPPEALHEGPDDYDLSLDVFSCGVIMMQIVFRLENVKSRRDRVSLKKEIVDGTHSAHPLRRYILLCLEDDKNDRPSATDLCHSLERQISGASD